MDEAGAVGERAVVDADAPCCAGEAVTRVRLDAMREEADRMRDRIDTALWTVSMAIAIDLLLRLGGP